MTESENVESEALEAVELDVNERREDRLFPGVAARRTAASVVALRIAVLVSRLFLLVPTTSFEMFLDCSVVRLAPSLNPGARARGSSARAEVDEGRGLVKRAFRPKRRMHSLPAFDSRVYR